MSFEPDDDLKLELLIDSVEETNILLKAIIILMSEQSGSDPIEVIDAAEHV